MTDKTDPMKIAIKAIARVKAKAHREWALYTDEDCVRAAFTALEAAGWEIRKKSENERLRKALSFYAESWEGHAGDSGPGGNWPADADCWPDDYLIEDCGERARQALACSPTYSQGKVWFELGLRVKCNKCGRKAEGILHPFNTPLCRPCGQDALKDQATSQGGDDGCAEKTAPATQQEAQP